MKTLEQLDIKPGMRILLRADFNVAMDGGKIADDFRMQATIPTINYLRKKGAKIIILSHLGRPEGKVNKKYTLAPVAKHLGKLLKIDIKFFEQITTAEIEISKMKQGDVTMLENLRFNQGEEGADEKFAQQLAQIGDVYVNDAFAVAHREHASTTVLPKLLPHAAGLLMQKEVDMLNRVREAQDKPLVFIMGGAKAETKFKILLNLFDRVDYFCIGGVMANAILKERGVNIGKSYTGENSKEYLKKLDLDSEKLQLIEDARVGEDPKGEIFRISDLSDIKESELILDIGPKTIEKFSNLIQNAGTVMWNGPMGFIENKLFRQGSLELVQALKNTNAKVVVGGGETIQVVDEAQIRGAVDYQSTGGGAMLDYLANGTLPAIEALE